MPHPSTSLTPLSPDARAVIRRIVNDAPALTPSRVAELSALFGGAQ